VGSIIFASYKYKHLNGGKPDPSDRILMYVVKCLPDDDCGRVLNYLAVPMPPDVIVRDADGPVTGEYTKTSIYGHIKGVAIGVESICVMSGVGGSSNHRARDAAMEHQESDDEDDSLVHRTVVIFGNPGSKVDDEDDLKEESEEYESDVPISSSTPQLAADAMRVSEKIDHVKSKVKSGWKTLKPIAAMLAQTEAMIGTIPMSIDRAAQTPDDDGEGLAVLADGEKLIYGSVTEIAKTSVSDYAEAIGKIAHYLRQYAGISSSIRMLERFNVTKMDSGRKVPTIKGLQTRLDVIKLNIAALNEEFVIGLSMQDGPLDLGGDEDPHTQSTKVISLSGFGLVMERRAEFRSTSTLRGPIESGEPARETSKSGGSRTNSMPPPTTPTLGSGHGTSVSSKVMGKRPLGVAASTDRGFGRSMSTPLSNAPQSAKTPSPSAPNTGASGKSTDDMISEILRGNKKAKTQGN